MFKNLLVILSCILMISSCKKVTTDNNEKPAIVTLSATDITSTSAMSGGIITNSNNAYIKSSGICWSVSENPTLLNPHTNDTTKLGTFKNNLLNLLPAKTYYVRAYLLSLTDTLYGNQIMFSTPDMHIYIGGYELVGPTYVAKYWKDGMPIVVTNGTYNARINSIYVVGSDLYAAGYESNGTKNVAKLWVNGVGTSLSNSNNDASANGVLVTNNIVYVVGFENIGGKKIAKLWKNSSSTNLTNGTNDGAANAITIANNNIYITGYENAGYQRIGKLWTNGVESSITSSPYDTEGSAIYASGNDIYIAGYESSGYPDYWVLLWKNGQPMTIDQNKYFFGRGTGVCISGNDVHLTGSTDKGGASYWKNGSAISLTNDFYSQANAIQVVGGKVYIVGTQRFNDIVNGNDLASFWVDKVATTLPHTGYFSYATSIFVQ